MLRSLAAACCFVLAPTVLQADDPIPLIIHPISPPADALRYRLLPELKKQKAGDAAPLYKNAAQLLEKLRRDGDQRYSWDEEMSHWLQAAPADLPRPAVRRFLDRYQGVFTALEEAVQCEQCHWDLAQRVREQGAMAPLPDIAPLRQCADLLALRARLAMAEGRFEDALASLRAGFTLARRLGQTPLVITNLVAIAITENLVPHVAAFVECDGAPNLYWALTDLPHPFIDLRQAFEGEKLMAYASFPGLADAAGNLKAGPLTAEQAAKLAQFLVALNSFRGEPLEVIKTAARRVDFGRDIVEKHEPAKRALVEAGRPRELVERMPHIQVAVLHALLVYEQHFNELVKWETFPYWQSRPHLEAAVQLVVRERKRQGVDAPALALEELLGPRADRVFGARARLERRLAALCAVEAVRAHAAPHGKLPAALADVRDWPVPLDPVFGQEFAYRVEGDRATLASPPLSGLPAGLAAGLSYELRLARRPGAKRVEEIP